MAYSNSSDNNKITHAEAISFNKKLNKNEIINLLSDILFYSVEYQNLFENEMTVSYTCRAFTITAYGASKQSNRIKGRYKKYIGKGYDQEMLSFFKQLLYDYWPGFQNDDIRMDDILEDYFNELKSPASSSNDLINTSDYNKSDQSEDYLVYSGNLGSFNNSGNSIQNKSSSYSHKGKSSNKRSKSNKTPNVPFMDSSSSQSSHSYDDTKSIVLGIVSIIIIILIIVFRSAIFNAISFLVRLLIHLIFPVCIFFGKNDEGKFFYKKKFIALIVYYVIDYIVGMILYNCGMLSLFKFLYQSVLE